MRKVAIFADGAGDIPEEIAKKYNVGLLYGTVSINGVEYIDKLTINPSEMFELSKATKSLPKTSAVNIDTYVEAFTPYLNKGYEIVNINLSSQISAAYHNAQVIAKERDDIFLIDSHSLSSGIAHLVIEAGEMRDKGYSAKQIHDSLIQLRDKVHATFVLNTLEYMAAGGRCSTVTAFGANILGIKPCIEMDKNGALQVIKKYRGNLAKVLPNYVHDQLTQNKKIRTDKIFITYSSATPEIVDIVRNAISKVATFDNIYETTASCTIATHCGPGTLGILFMSE